MGAAVDRECAVWAVLKREQENGRRLDPEGRAPAWGGRSPWPWTAGVAVAETWLAWENATDGPATRGRAQTRPRCLESQSLVSC